LPLFGAVVCCELCIQVVEGVAGDVQSGQHLLTGGFALAMLFALVADPLGGAAHDSDQDQRGGQPLP
jgi:hypothetical protein